MLDHGVQLEEHVQPTVLPLDSQNPYKMCRNLMLYNYEIYHVLKLVLCLNRLGSLIFVITCIMRFFFTVNFKSCSFIFGIFVEDYCLTKKEKLASNLMSIESY